MLSGDKTLSNTNEIQSVEELFKSLEQLMPLKKKQEQSKGIYKFSEAEEALWSEVAIKTTRYLEKSENLNPLTELANQDLSREEQKQKLDLMFTIDMGIRAKVLKKSSDEFPNPLYEMIFHADVSVGNIQTKTPQVVSILRYLLRNLDLKYLQNMLRAEPESGMKISALQQAFDRGNRELAGVIFEALAQTTGEKIKLLKSIKQAVQPNIFPFLITRFCNFEVETKLLKRAQEGKAQDFEAIFKCNLHMVTPEIWRYEISVLRGVSKVFGELELTLRNEKLEELKKAVEKLDNSYTDESVKKAIESLTEILDTISPDSRVNLNVAIEKYKIRKNLLGLILEKGNVSLAKRLIDLGVNVNLGDHEGEMPLHFAVKKGSLEVVKKLVAAGADVNVCNKKMESPLYIASDYGKFEIVKVLLSSGALVNQPYGEQKGTPLQRAASRGYSNIVRELIEFGADVSIENNVKNTALHYAAVSGKIDIIKQLIAAGEDINHRGYDNSSALVMAIKNKCFDAAKFLMEAGADVNLRNQHSDSPLFYAIANCANDLVILLIQKGALITEIEIREAEQKEQQLKRQNTLTTGSFFEITNILKILKDPKDLQAQLAFAISLATKTDPLSSSFLGAFSDDAKAKIMDFAKGISEIVMEHVNKTIKPDAQAPERQL